jgi:hypothetical protein
MPQKRAGVASPGSDKPFLALSPRKVEIQGVKLDVTKEIIFTVVFMTLLGMICCNNSMIFLMTVCICTAFGALCFVWESKDKKDEKFFLLACALALTSLGLLFYLSGGVHTDATIRSKIYHAYPKARKAYEFCEFIVANTPGWAAEHGVNVEFMKEKSWSDILII